MVDSPQSETRNAAIVAFAAAASMVVGAFLPWVKISAPLVGEISKSGMDGGDGIILLGTGTIVAALALKILNGAETRRTTYAIGLLGVAALALMIWEGNNISQRFNDVKNQSDLVATSYGSGLFLGGLGGVLAVCAGWLSENAIGRRQHTQGADAHQSEAESALRVEPPHSIRSAVAPTVCPHCREPWQPNDAGLCHECGKSPFAPPRSQPRGT